MTTPADLRVMADTIDGLLKSSSVWVVARRAEDLLIDVRGELRLRATELEERTITPGDAAAEGQG